MITTAFFLPNLNVGGAEMVTVRLLRHLNRSKIRPVLILLRKTGRLLDLVPRDVPIVDLGREKRIHLPRAAARLGPALREHSVDVLLSEIEVPTLMSLVSRPLLPRTLILGMIEHSIPSIILPPKTPLVPLYKRIYKRHDLVIAVSEIAAKDLRANFGIKDVHVIHNPIEIDELSAHGPSPHPWLDGDAPTILFLGRLDPQKGPDVLRAAFDIVRKETRARLLMFGEGSMKIAPGPDVALPGHLATVGPALRRATVVVIPSRVEGFSLVAAEAMACGAPVVATRCGVEEYLRDGENGLLVPVENPAALARAIVRVLKEPELRQLIAKAGRETASQFDARAIARRYEQVLATACRAR